ncbi:MAG TPA: Tox-REase-5 domain-containing protein, partial [Archangium sp.]|nr:Tox-REase-5 domain-containing protein [Archangium sp.]
YQEQVTGQPPSRIYMVGQVEFDGFTGKELLEAKGPRYIKFFNEDGTPKYWYEESGKFDGMLAQARAQWDVARRAGLPLIWHVADAEVAKFLRKIFEREGLSEISVRHTKPAR